MVTSLVSAQTFFVYDTGFEPGNGFSIDQPLAGQSGWIGVGSDQFLQFGGNGLVTNFFEGEGQQAYIGFSPLSGTNDILNVWRPLNYSPLAAGTPAVKFSVSMAIFDSTIRYYDSFLWSVYNTNNPGQRLFSIDFDNVTGNICYLLDDGIFVPTGFAFELAGPDGLGLYDLEVTMNFASNRWSASLNGTIIANARPMTTKGAMLNLGDIDAVWINQTPGSPGDNFMVFDNYRVTAEKALPLPAQLAPVAGPGGGAFVLRLQGEPGRSYALDASADLAAWTALKTNVVGIDGMVDFADTSAGAWAHRFYRGRLVP
ncbi:MAG TPA: hypothetical protein VLU94_02145 [Candidatus Nitrosotalea sp.]|nr:hypothetical protein [Candidatus Nitrosotalea sp.]